MKKLALSGAALGVAMAVGTAQAEPLTLSADQMDQVTAAGTGSVQFTLNIRNRLNSDKLFRLRKLADVAVRTRIDGWVADAEAGANCFGFGCIVETKTAAETDFFQFKGVAFSSSVAASDF